jgi:hypothetical protein
MKAIIEDVRARFLAIRSEADVAPIRESVEFVAGKMADRHVPGFADLTASQNAVLLMFFVAEGFPDGAGFGHESLTKFFGRDVSEDIAVLRSHGLIEGGPPLH